MDIVLLTLILGLVALAAVYGVARWAARMERPGHRRHLSNRVYYPRRGKADSQVRLPGQGGAPTGEDVPSQD